MIIHVNGQMISLCQMRLKKKSHVDGVSMELIKKIGKKINDYGVLVMFSHTIFSLSFALISMLLAGNGHLDFKTIFSG